MNPRIGKLIRNGKPVYYIYIDQDCVEFYSLIAAEFYANKLDQKGA